MNKDLTKQEVQLIRRLIKKEFNHVKTETALAKLFELQNKLNFISSSLPLKDKYKNKVEDFIIMNCKDKEDYVICNGREFTIE